MAGDIVERLLRADAFSAKMARSELDLPQPLYGDAAREIATLRAQLADADRRVAELEAHWKSISIFVGIEGAKLSGLDGMNYDSGQEYAFRRVAIEMNARKALSVPLPNLFGPTPPTAKDDP